MAEQQDEQGGAEQQPGSALPDLIRWKANPLLLEARFPTELVNNPQGLAQFLQVAVAIDLNPFLGEIVPIHGRPYITEEGWLRMVDERAPGQLIVDRTEMADAEDYKRFGVSGGWLAKATVVRRVSTLDGKTEDREVTDWAFLSKAEVDASKITAIRDEPWRQAMKIAHVRALRKTFRDVVARSAADYVVAGGLEEEGPIIEAEVLHTVDRLAKQGVQEDTEATERSRFWARASEAGIRNGSEELAKVLGLPESGVGAMKKHWLDAGRTWMEANQKLSEYLAEDPRTAIRCSYCDKPISDADGPMYSPEGALCCSENCAESQHQKEVTKHEQGRPRRTRARR